MQSKTQNFPWRILKKFLLKSTLLFVAVFLCVFGLFRYLFIHDLEKLYPQVEWVPFLNAALAFAVGSSLVVFTGMLTFVFFELLFPLGVLFSRVKSIVDRPDLESDSDLSQEESGEWSDLELAVEDIRQKLKKSQKKITRERVTISTLLDAIPEAIFAVDNEGKAIFCNSSFLDIFSLNRAELSSTRLTEIIRSPEVLSTLEQTLRDKSAQKVQAKIRPAAGAGLKTFQITVAPLSDFDNQRLYGAVCVFQDITELLQLEQVRIDFVANVSHELRTPLTSVKGYAQTLFEDIKANRFDQGEKYLQIVTRNVDRLLSLTSDLLDLSSLDSGVQINAKKISLTTVTENVLEQLKFLQNEKKIKISTKYEVDNLWADDVRIQQVLLNLIQNALQYIPNEKSVEIAWLKNENGVELHVTDNGPGIDEEHRSRIFERFYRVDRARARESGGTGLGLAIVKHVMQRHGGRVFLESELGKGSKFVCVFPAQNTNLS